MEAYYLWRIFFSWLVKVFFAEIEVVGSEYIPTEGPVIFVGNHQNQFIDPALILAHCKRKLGFLIAASSLKRPVVGYFARQLESIPVIRAQDAAIVGKGTVTITGTKVFGNGTTFTSSFVNGASFWSPGETDGIRIAKLVSDTELDLANAPHKGDANNSKYKIIPKLDQHEVYEGVWTRLHEGGCIGIFPEGGSHDRSDLLPLKAGVSIMALGAMAKYEGLQVSIVPCGLNYWHGHRFRSTVVVEFGRPYKVPFDLVEQYAEGHKREACGILLEKTEAILRAVTFNACDYATRRMIQTIRKLSQPTHIQLTVEAYMEFNRKLAKAYEQLKAENFANDTDNVKELSERVMNYNDRLEMVGVKDDHVASEDNLNSTLEFLGMVTLRFWLLVLIVLGAGPGIILNLPIAIIARLVAKQQAKKALAGSAVKLQGMDVMASYKLIIGLVVTPLLYTFYSILVLYYFGFAYLLLFVLIFPLVSWASVRISEEGVRLAKSFVVLLRVQWWSTELKKLRIERSALQAMAINFAGQVAPQFCTDVPADTMHETTPVSPLSVVNRSTGRHGFIPKKEEYRRQGLRINESYENLEMALMDEDER